jgi:acetolactate synthase I/II/III large subunit
MDGAEALFRTLLGAGVEVCFANPGTSEMHCVAAIDRVEGMRGILCLFEGVATGAADGYARMAGKPAATLLHLGPGLMNGLANLHNAKKAATPLVNIIGEHATFHATADARLHSDILAFARPASGWVAVSRSALTVARDGARAVQAARQAPGQVATLILPADVAWSEADGPAPPLPVQGPSPTAAAAVDAAVAALKSGGKIMLLLGDAALTEDGLRAAGRIAAATGAQPVADYATARLPRGAGRVRPWRLPYFPEDVRKFLAGVTTLVLVGARPPVPLFGYCGQSPWLTPQGCRLLVLAEPHEDCPGALAAVAEALKAPAMPAHVAPLNRPDLPTGRLDAMKAGQVIGHFLPEHAIIADESATSGAGANRFTATAPPHDHLSLTGGAIGAGVPLATGAAVACPDRKVVCLQADGGGMYTLQALWTQARERLDVTTVIFANRTYAILNVELARAQIGNPGPKALSLLDLGNPTLDWVSLARGMGVEASRAETAEEFAAQFSSAMKQKGTRLIEAVL